MTNEAVGRIDVDAVLFAPSEAKVSVLDHGLLYGDGVFESFRTYGGRPFRLEAHLARLETALATVGIEGAPSRSTIAQRLERALRESGLGEAYCRVTVTRGVGTRGLDPRACGAPTTIIAALPLRSLPVSAYANGYHAVLLWPRARDDRPPPSVKTTSYQRTTLARLEIARRGADEGFFLDEKGAITEGSTSNVFVVSGKTLVTPPADVCLRGVTRDEVIAIAQGEGFTIREEALSPARLAAADEVFLTSSLAELVSVTRFEGNAIGDGKPGPVQRFLLERYRERTQ